jgi:hypothetical protein
VTFTGETVFAGNDPAQFDETELSEPATTQEAAKDKVADE